MNFCTGLISISAKSLEKQYRPLILCGKRKNPSTGFDSEKAKEIFKLNLDRNS